jgi:hypothetical protein
MLNLVACVLSVVVAITLGLLAVLAPPMVNPPFAALAIVINVVSVAGNGFLAGRELR